VQSHAGLSQSPTVTPLSSAIISSAYTYTFLPTLTTNC
jgi:hypothetical protein